MFSFKEEMAELFNEADWGFGMEWEQLADETVARAGLALTSPTPRSSLWLSPGSRAPDPQSSP